MLLRVNIIGFILFLPTVLFSQTGIDSSAVPPLSKNTQSINMGWLLFKTMGVLVLIILLIFILVYFLKKYFFNSSTAGGDLECIQVLGQTQIRPKKFLALVKVLNRVILVGLTDSSMETLTEFEDTSKIQPYLDKLNKKPGKWNESRFLKIIKKNMQ